MEPELDSTHTKLSPRPSWANSSLTTVFLMPLALTHTLQVWASENHCDMFFLSFHSTKCGCQKGQSRSWDWQLGGAGLIPCQAVQKVLVWKQTLAIITERFLIQPCLTHVNSSSTLQKISLINQLSSIMCSLVVRFQPLSINSSAHTWTPLGLSNCSYTNELTSFFRKIIIWQFTATEWWPERKHTDFTIPNGVIWHGTYFLNRFFPTNLISIPAFPWNDPIWLFLFRESQEWQDRDISEGSCAAPSPCPPWDVGMSAALAGGDGGDESPSSTLGNLCLQATFMMP